MFQRSLFANTQVVFINFCRTPRGSVFEYPHRMSYEKLEAREKSTCDALHFKPRLSFGKEKEYIVSE